MLENEYQKMFSIDKVDKSFQKEALKHALDIRKFEIELYWKRATYFWAFIASVFAAYALLKTESTLPNQVLIIILSMLEDNVIGPLYKVVLSEEKNCFSFPFSVSKINYFIAIYIFLFWIFIFLYELKFFDFGLFKELGIFAPSSWAIVAVCYIFIHILLVCTKTRETNNIKIKAKKRITNIVE